MISENLEIIEKSVEFATDYSYPELQLAVVSHILESNNRQRWENPIPNMEKLNELVLLLTEDPANPNGDNHFLKGHGLFFHPTAETALIRAMVTTLAYASKAGILSSIVEEEVAVETLPFTHEGLCIMLVELISNSQLTDEAKVIIIVSNIKTYLQDMGLDPEFLMKIYLKYLRITKHDTYLSRNN